MTRSTALATCTATCLITASLHAAPFAYEGFDVPGDYTNGVGIETAVTGNPGSGFSTAWVNTKTNAASDDNDITGSALGLEYTDSKGNVLSTTAGSAFNAASDRADDYHREFTLPTTPTAGGELWMSLLFERGAASKNWGVTLDSGTSSGLAGFGIGDDNSTGSGSFPGVSAAIQGTFGNRLEVAYDATVFVVGRVTFDATDVGNSPTMDIWVNPDLDEDLSLAAVGAGDATHTRSYAGSTGTDLLVIYSHQDNEITFDEIRLGESWSDVVAIEGEVPEPSSVALIGLGCLTLLGHRRKRLAV